MTSALHQLLGAAALLVSTALAPAVAEEPNRPWTDPPASHAPVDETVTYPDPPVSSPGDSAAAAASLEAGPSAERSPPPEPTETSTVDPKGSGKGNGKNNAIAGSDQKEGSEPAQPVLTAKPAGGTASPQTPPTRNATAAKVGTKVSKNAAERRTRAASVKSATRTKAASRNRQARSRGSIVASEAARGSLERRMVEVRPGYRRLRSVGEALDAGLMVTTVRTIQLPDGRRIEIESEPDPRTRLDVVVRPF